MTFAHDRLLSLLVPLIPTACGVIFPLILGFAPRAMVVTLLFAAIASAGYAAWLKRHARPLTLEPPALRAGGLLLALLGYIAVSSFWSGSPRVFEMARDVLMVGLAALALVRLIPLYGHDFSERFMRAMVPTVGVVFTLVILNMLCGYPLQVWTTDLLTQSIAETNMPKRAEALLVLFIWPCALWLWQRGYRSNAKALLLGAAVLSIGFTSRTAMLGLVAGVALYGIATRWPRAARLVGFGLLPLSLFVMLLFALFAHDAPLEVRMALPASADQRLQIWDYASTQAIQHMPFGIGLDGSRSFGEGDQSITESGIPFDILPIHPHNVYIQIWLELGLPGVLLITTLMFLVWQTIRRLPADLQPLLWGYIATATITLAAAYGAWQAWWLAGHAQAAILMAYAIRTQPSPQQRATNDNHA